MKLSHNPFPYQKNTPSPKLANFFSLLFTIFLIVSIPLIFWTVNLYWNTLINGPRLILLAIGIGFSVTIILRKHIDLSSPQNELPDSVKLLLFCVCNSFSIGTTIIFFILWSNQAFGGRTQVDTKLPVVSFGHTRGHRNSDPVPYVDVVYKDKEVRKYYPRYADVEHIDSLRTRIIDGWLGFEVVQVE